MMPLHRYSMKTKPNFTAECSTKTTLDQRFILMHRQNQSFVKITPIIFLSGRLLPNKVWVWFTCPVNFIEPCKIQEVILYKQKYRLASMQLPEIYFVNDFYIVFLNVQSFSCTFVYQQKLNLVTNLIL